MNIKVLSKSLGDLRLSVVELMKAKRRSDQDKEDAAQEKMLAELEAKKQASAPKYVHEDMVGKGYADHEAAALSGKAEAPRSSSKQETPDLTPAFLKGIRKHAGKWIDNYEADRGAKAVAELNPHIHANAQTKNMVDKAYSGLDKAMATYRDSDEYKQAHPFLQPEMEAEFQKKFLEKNPRDAKAINSIGDTTDIRHKNKIASLERGSEDLRGIAQGGSASGTALMDPTENVQYNPEHDSELVQMQENINAAQEAHDANPTQESAAALSRAQKEFNRTKDIRETYGSSMAETIGVASQAKGFAAGMAGGAKTEEGEAPTVGTTQNTQTSFARNNANKSDKFAAKASSLSEQAEQRKASLANKNKPALPPTPAPEPQTPAQAPSPSMKPNLAMKSILDNPEIKNRLNAINTAKGKLPKSGDNS